MPTKQSSTPKEGRRTTSIGNTSRTVARNQHRHYWAITKVKQDGRNSRHCRLIHKNDSFKSNDDECFIRRNSKDLQGRHLETTWNT